jgi:hypothetical protein
MLPPGLVRGQISGELPLDALDDVFGFAAILRTRFPMIGLKHMTRARKCL